MLNGMIVEPVDNVVVAIEPVKKGETVTYMCAGRGEAPDCGGGHHHLSQAGCLRHRQRPAHRQVRRAHRPGGRDIKAGEHVHCHNLEEHRENLDSKG